MTSVQRTAIVVIVIVTVTSAATAPIRAAEDVRVEMNSKVESDAASTTGEVSLAVELGDRLPLLVAVDLTRGQLLTIGQLQPTKLKKVSRKKAIIILAVVVTAVVLITYELALRGFHPVFTSLNEAGPVPAQADQPPVATRH